jgi:hypothetical protein
MGLKTNNYVSKSTELPLYEAYAILTNLIIEKDNSARAIFSIQKDRDSIKRLAPADKVEIRFIWDRKTNPVEMAYEVAKTEIRTKETYNEKGEPIIETELGTLYGWQDDKL